MQSLIDYLRPAFNCHPHKMLQWILIGISIVYSAWLLCKARYTIADWILRPYRDKKKQILEEHHDQCVQHLQKFGQVTSSQMRGDINEYNRLYTNEQQLIQRAVAFDQYIQSINPAGVDEQVIDDMGRLALTLTATVVVFGGLLVFIFVCTVNAPLMATFIGNGIVYFTLEPRNIKLSCPAFNHAEVCGGTLFWTTESCQEKFDLVPRSAKKHEESSKPCIVTSQICRDHNLCPAARTRPKRKMTSQECQEHNLCPPISEEACRKAGFCPGWYEKTEIRNQDAKSGDD